MLVTTIVAGMIFHICVAGGASKNGSTALTRYDVNCLQQDDSCTVAGEDRYDCGFPGITQEECLHGRQCCWDNTIRDTNWCFFPEPAPCDIPENRRFDCGHRGITVQGCKDSGCCYQAAQGQGVPWCYYKRYSPLTEFHSSDDNELWLPMHQTTFSFTVEACENAVVYLSKYPRTGREAVYEIVIGGTSNTKSAIYKYVDNKQLGSAIADSRNVLGCSSPVAFYLTWYNGHVILGTSASDDDLVVEWEDSDPIVVNAVGVGSPGRTSVWKFSERSGQSVLVNTREDKPSEAQPDVWMEFEPGQTDVVFKVRACANAYVQLTENRLTNQGVYGYEIALGKEGNSQSGIRRLGFGDDGTLDVSTPSILDCDNFRYFWVSWKDGHVEVGEGHRIGYQRFIDKMYLNPDPIRFLSVTVRNILERSVSWEFKKWKGEHFTVRTPPTPHTNVTFHANTHREYFLFDLQTCFDAHVYLATDLNHYRYGIQLGQNNNVSRITLYNWPDVAKVLYERPTPDILSCAEPRPFWISWQNQHIIVGRGSVPHKHEFLTFWDTSVAQAITGIGLRTDGGIGEWNFATNLVDKTLSVLPNQYRYDRLWYHALQESSIQFQVQACEDANVALTEYAGITTGQTYEISVGANGNSRTEIRDMESGEILRDVSGKILGCNVWTPIWISWADRTLSMGTGTTIGANKLLSVYNYQYKINAVGISSSSNNNGLTKWEFANPVGEVYELFTKAGEPIRKFSFLLYNSHFLFKVRACQGIVIALLDDPEGEVEDNYVIQIGEERNSRTSIYRNGQRVSTGQTDAVLDCSERRAFWLTWPDGHLRVGQGDVLGEQILTGYTDSNPFRVNAISVTSNETREAQWTVQQSSVTSIRVDTPAQYSYNYMWQTTGGVRYSVFRVRACNDAHISLSSVASTPGLHDVSEIVLGASGNTRTLIRSGRLTGNQRVAVTPGVLSCDDARYFWISWLDGRVEVGKGSVVGGNLLVGWQDPDPHPVAILAVSTGWGATGRWEFRQDNEEMYVIKTRPTSTNSLSVQIIPSTYELRFSVQACKEAVIDMYQGYGTTRAYQFVVGGEENSVVYVIRADDTTWPGDQEVQAPSILSCTDVRGFVLRWGPGGFALTGADGTFYFYWTDPDPLTVYSITPRTKGVEGLWTFPRSQGESVRAFTSNEGDVPLEEKYDSLWLSTRERKSRVLQVKACANAHVLLATYLRFPQRSAYEVRLSTAGNKSSIWKIGEDSPCAEEATGDLLDCNNFRFIWLDWEGRYVTVGRGEIVGDQRLLQCELDIDVTALTLASDKGATAEWTLQDTKGEVYKFWTENKYPYWRFDKAWIVPRRAFLTFDVQAREWVALALSYAPWTTGNNTYEVHIGRIEGAGVQQYSAILDMSTGTELVRVPTPHLVSSGSLNSFWVTWEEGFIAVGMGHSKYQGITIMRTDTVRNPIKAVSFATPRDDGHWQFTKDQVQHVDLHTANVESAAAGLEMTTRGMDRAVVQVRATDSARLRLHLSVTDAEDRTYDLIIGGEDNTKTVLGLVSGQQPWQVLTQADTPGVLSYEEKRTFWLSWSNGIVRCGKGATVGREVLLVYQESTDIAVNAIALSNPLGRKTAHWSLGQLQGNTFNVHTATEYSYKKIWMSVAKANLLFRVRACSDAAVLLSQSLNKDNATTYEIVLGGYSNQRLFIRRGLQSQPLAWVDLPQVVDCDNFRWFWVTWDAGNLTVGSGPWFTHPLLHTADPVPIPVNYVSVSTGWGSDGEWELSHEQAENLFLFTGSADGASYETTSVAIQGNNYFLFNVTACEGAQVAISYVPNLVSAFALELTFGRNGSRGVSLREQVDGMELSVAADDEIMVSCDVSQAFWVWWSMNYFHIGRGDDIEKEDQILIKHALAEPLQVNGVQFRTAPNIHGQWVFRQTGVKPEKGRGGPLGGGAVAGIVIAVILVAVLAVGAVLYRHEPAREGANNALRNIRNISFRSSPPVTGATGESKAYIDPQDIMKQVMGADNLQN